MTKAPVEDARLTQLREQLASRQPRVTWAMRISAALVVAGGAAMITGTLLPWAYKEGVSVAAIREGTENGFLSAVIDAVAAVDVVTGFAVLGWTRRRPRFVHLVGAIAAPPLIGLCVDQYRNIDHQAHVYRLDFHPTAMTGVGPGIVVAVVGLALTLVAAALAARQAWRTLQT